MAQSLLSVAAWRRMLLCLLLAASACSSADHPPDVRQLAAALREDGVLERVLADPAVARAVRAATQVERASPVRMPTPGAPSTEGGHTRDDSGAQTPTGTARIAAASSAGLHAPSPRAVQDTDHPQMLRITDSLLPRRLQDSSAECPAPKPARLRGATDRQHLNFTAQYSDSPNCTWVITCSKSQAVFVRFVSFSSEYRRDAGYSDALSLYDGADRSASSPPLDVLCGTATPAAFAAESGSMILEWTYEYNDTTPSFAIEYWCAAASEIVRGCTDSSSLSFDSAATADDGSCYDHERHALLDSFVFDVGSRPLERWNATAYPYPCTCRPERWEGVRCSADKHIITIELRNASDVIFTLGEELAQLTSLRYLSLWGSGLHGKMPQALGRIATLQTLDLSETALSGAIPTIATESLKHLILYQTRLSGTIPSSVSEATNLVTLGLSSTRISGTLSEDIGRMSSLATLDLQKSAITGSLPLALGQVSTLQCLALSDMSLSGYLPSTIQQMASLWSLTIEGSQISGTLVKSLTNIPNFRSTAPSFACCSRCTCCQSDNAPLLDLRGSTGISGTLITAMSEMKALGTLGLGSTHVSGTLGAAIGGMTALQEFSMAGTRVSGTLPRDLNGLRQLLRLQIFASRLSGTIPSAVRALTSMQILDLPDTYISGTIPPEMGTLTVLQELSLYNCRLSGTLPPQIGHLDKLMYLYLDSNALAGAVPDLSGCRSLRVLRLTNNSFTSLPAAAPDNVTHVYLDQNPLNASAIDLNDLTHGLGNLHTLSVGIVNVPIILESSALYPDARCNVQSERGDVGKGCRGTWVQKPSSCRVGQPCSWLLLLRDADDQAAREGGLLRNLSIAYCDGIAAASCHYSTPMIDNRNGTFTATVPPGWIRTEGQYAFRFFHEGQEFHPSMSADNTGIQYDTLRTVQYEPRQCSETQYDSRTFGVLVCTTGDWKPAESLTGAYVDAAARISSDQFCVECPSECTTCNGSVTVREGWRPSIVDAAEVSTILRNPADRRNPADSLTPLFVFRCPGSTYGLDGSCPQLLLDRTPKATPHGACLANHTGRLCESCERRYSRRSHECQPCGHDAIEHHFGVPVGAFVVFVVASGLAVLALLMKLKATIKRVKAPVWSLVKIALGLAQVLGLLKDCLNIIYPPGPSRGLNYLQLFTGDVKTLVQFDCHGWDWFDVWRLTVLVVPGLAVAVCCVRYGWQRWRGNLDAKPNAISSVFFVVLLLYPRVSTGIMSALRCRQLGVELSVLDMDYDVSCSDPRYARYRLCAWVLLVAWPVGIPLGLLASLWRHYHRNKQEFAAMADQSLRSGVKMRQSYGAAEHNRSKLIERYDFCLDSYRPGCWYWEPLDMLRKLALSGLLQFVQRGTAAQVLVGCVLAFGAFGVHVRLLPYREAEANLLKACAEMLIFLVFLVSFILRVLPRIDNDEPVGSRGYGYVLMCSVGAFVAVFIGLVTKQFHRHRHFQMGLEEFAAGIFGGEEGVELGLLTRGRSQLHADEGGARDGEPTPEFSGGGYTTLAGVEPEPEAQFDEDATHQRRGSKRAALVATV